jgi:hypothetical protein
MWNPQLFLFAATHRIKNRRAVEQDGRRLRRMTTTMIRLIFLVMSGLRLDLATIIQMERAFRCSVSTEVEFACNQIPAPTWTQWSAQSWRDILSSSCNIPLILSSSCSAVQPNLTLSRVKRTDVFLPSILVNGQERTKTFSSTTPFSQSIQSTICCCI